MRGEGGLFDDLARMAGGALSSAGALRDEVEARLRERLEAALERMDLVRRDEFDAVREMAVQARRENENLAARLAALEARDAGAEARAAADAKSRAPG